MKTNLQNVIQFAITGYNATRYKEEDPACQARAAAYKIVLEELNAELQPYKDQKDPIIFDEITGNARLDLITDNNLPDWTDSVHD